MSDRTLIVSFGGTHPAKIERARNITWQAFAKALVREPKVADDKAAFGWYCPAEFDPPYRDSDNFVARHAITFDFDHVEADTPEKVAAVWKTKAFALYTTYSHTVEKPRFRVVMPLSRPAGYDEFQAVARKIASQVGIELIARESFVPAQMMYVPSRRESAVHASHLNEGDWIDVDATLAEYSDWTNVGEWPRRQERDGLHLVREPGISPIDKPGIVGDFCRAFSIEECIERFDLPYDRNR